MTKRTTPLCDEHENADGCLCGMPIGLHEATHDRDLPEAAGGVEGDLKPKAKARTKAERIAAEGDA